MYSEQTLDHFSRPRNAGDLPEANARASVENPICGDVLELAATVSDGVIEEARFRAQGCVPLIACASAITEMITGKTIDQALSFESETLLSAVGPLPRASGHAAEMVVAAVRQLLEKSVKCAGDKAQTSSFPRGLEAR